MVGRTEAHAQCETMALSLDELLRDTNVRSFETIASAIALADTAVIEAHFWEVIDLVVRLADRQPSAIAQRRDAALHIVAKCSSPREVIAAAKGYLYSAGTSLSLAFASQLIISAVAAASQGDRPLKNAMLRDLLNCFEDTATARWRSSTDVALWETLTLASIALITSASAGLSDAVLRADSARLLLCCVRGCVCAMHHAGASDDDRSQYVALIGILMRFLSEELRLDVAELLRLCVPAASHLLLIPTQPEMGTAFGDGAAISVERQLALQAFSDEADIDGGESNASTSQRSRLRSCLAVIPHLLSLCGTSGEGSSVTGMPDDDRLDSPLMQPTMFDGLHKRQRAEASVPTFLPCRLLPSPLPLIRQVETLLPLLSLLLQEASALAANVDAADDSMLVDEDDDDGNDVRMSDVGDDEDDDDARGGRRRQAEKAKQAREQTQYADAVFAMTLSAVHFFSSLLCASDIRQRLYIRLPQSMLSAAKQSTNGGNDAGNHLTTAAVPIELALFQALLALMVNSPGADLRQACFRLHRPLSAAFTAGSRFYMYHRLLTSCPYPAVMAVLLDAVRSDVAAALRSNSSAASGCRSAGANTSSDAAASCTMAGHHSPYANCRVHDLIAAAVGNRLKTGLLLTSAQLSGCAGRSDDDVARARRQATHLEPWADCDVALFSLIRLCVLRQRAQGSDQGGLIAPQQLRDLRAGYLQPLASVVAACQTALRQPLHIQSLHAHPAPFPSAAGASSAGGAAGQGGTGTSAAGRPVADSGTLSASSLPPIPDRPEGAALAPQPGDGQLLSKLFLLEGALSPLMELVEEALP